MAFTNDQWLKAGELGLGAFGGLFGGLAQGRQQQQQQQQGAQAQLIQALLQRNQANPFQQAEFAQRQAMLSQLLPNMTNAGSFYDPTTGRGGFTGGLRIPESGFGQGVQDAFNPATTQASANQFSGQMDQALQGMQQSAGEKKKKGGGIGGFFKGLGKGLLKAAPIAAGFIPGVGPLAAAGIGAAAGAAGGGGKGALIGGLMGGLGSKIPGMNKLPGMNAPLAPGNAQSLPFQGWAQPMMRDIISGGLNTSINQNRFTGSDPISDRLMQIPGLGAGTNPLERFPMSSPYADSDGSQRLSDLIMRQRARGPVNPALGARF